MRYPTIPVRRTERAVLDRFRGLNKSPRPGEGEFSEMENLSSDAYPVLSPRKSRGVFAKPASPQGLLAGDVLCYVDGADLMLGETRIPMELSVEPGDCPKRMQSMGAFIVILPDKKYINTANPDDRGEIEAFATGENPAFTLCCQDGEDYSEGIFSETAPENPENGQLWLDSTGLKQYSAAQEEWTAIAATYVKITAPGIGTGFRAQDAVKISGCQVEELNGSHVLWAVGEDFVVVEGLLTGNTSQQDPVTLERRMPVMDFITESGNRLWGCRYGLSADGDFVNEIYASKQGDFRNWSCYMGLSTDSYAAGCGVSGPFTGAAAHMGYPLFFRENCIHKVYGTEPAAYQIQTTFCRGVQPGCSESLALVGSMLVYKSREGVCAYDGSLPVPVSHALGRKAYHSAAAGALGDKYYISMADEENAWHLLVWDSARNLWHREDGLHASHFAALGQELFAIDAQSRNILGLLGSGEPEDQVAWMAQMGDLGLEEPDSKYISRLTLRLSLEPGARLECQASYDEEDTWETLGVVFGTDLRSLRLPLRPRRCDHIKLRLLGTGQARVYAITRTIEKGSDRF